MLNRFGLNAEVHAFEANPEKANELRMAAEQRAITRNFSQRMHVHNLGVSSTVDFTRIAMCGGQNTWGLESTRAIVDGKVHKCKMGRVINQTTLDHFVATHRANPYLPPYQERDTPKRIS